MAIHMALHAGLHSALHHIALATHPLVQMGALERGLKARGSAASAGASCQQATAPAAQRLAERQAGGSKQVGRFTVAQQ